MDFQNTQLIGAKPSQKENEMDMKKSTSMGNLSNITGITEVSSYGGWDHELEISGNLDGDFFFFDEEEEDEEEEDDDHVIHDHDESHSSSKSQSHVSLLDGPPESNQGVPKEIVVISDSASVDDESLDIQSRLKTAESLIQSYKDKLTSSENLADNLLQYLREAQERAEDLTSDKEELLEAFQDVEFEENRKAKQNLLLRSMMGVSLFLYLCGASERLLIVSVSINLIVETISAFV